MTTKEAAVEWGISIKTVRIYCTKKYIEKAKLKKTKNGKRWFIPPTALRPFVSTAKRQTTIRKNILKAVDMNYSFNHHSFHCTKKRLEAIVEALILEHLLIKTSTSELVVSESGRRLIHPVSSLNPVKDMVVPLLQAGIQAGVGHLLANAKP